MASKSRIKGNYHENFFVKLFKDWRIKCKKQPLSGSLGGEYSGDLILTLNGIRLVAEVKYRKSTSFPSPFTVLDNRDVALFKRGTGTNPKWVMVIPDRIVKQLFVKEKSNGTNHIYKK